MTAQRHRPLFVVTILVGSFLLFLVQPLVARMALPRLGGAPAVWNSAMLVYQALLLAGYAYAHALSRLPIARQAAIQLVLLALAGATLPIALAELAPPARGREALWVPMLFLQTIGLVFFVVSAQAPLMQRWYAAEPEAGDPYWLYAAANLGSLVGLLAYPALFEPNLTLANQSLLWSGAYVLLIVLVAAAAWSRRQARPPDGDALEAAEPLGRRRIGLWLALAAVPSGLMLSTTTLLTTDIVAMPLLWVIPLGLYLLSFVFAFNRRSALGHALARVAPVIVLLAGATAMVSHGAQGLRPALAILIMLFVLSVALHRRLYADRPSPGRLTLFYLVMSAGGALGGLFAALIAPVVFDWVWEHPLLVLAGAALLPDRPLAPWLDRLGLRDGARRKAMVVVLLATVLLSGLLAQAVAQQRDLLVLAATIAIALCGVLVLGSRWAFVAVLLLLMVGRGGYQTLQSSWEGGRERSYFGIYEVQYEDRGEIRSLIHGTTLHGRQFVDPARRLEPTTYYGRSSGVGLALRGSRELVGEGARVGIVGLGVGTLACYRKPGQTFEFFEIDPLVLGYSRREIFTFVGHCAPSAPVHIGDARLALADMEPGRFDILILDAFSSDAIPLHLMTREAFAIYKRVLADNGLILAHISNRFMDLAPMVAALAEAHGLEARMRTDLQPAGPGTTGSVWVALSPDPSVLKTLSAAGAAGAWSALPEPAERVWTDDFASILPFLQWENLLGSDS